MNREFLKSLGLEDEAIEKIMTEHGKTVNTTKQELGTVTTERDSLKTELANRDTQLTNLKKEAKDNQELTNRINDLEQENKTFEEESEKKLAAQRKEFKLELALKDALAKNPKAVKALLNQEAISLDGDNLIGLEEQLKSLKESDAYLFGEEQPAGLKGRQPHPTDPGGKPAPQKNPFSKEHFNLTEQGRLLKEDPELYKQLKASAK